MRGKSALKNYIDKLTGLQNSSRSSPYASRMLKVRRTRDEMRWLIRSVVGVLLLVLMGTAYQALETALDGQRYPPPGRLVDVGGHELHLHCSGEGTPTVILESANIGWSLYWTKVQSDLSSLTRVCSYDRAGLGWSERGPSPRTGRQIAKELHTLLARARISGPYILVGHSIGGFVTRLYRESYREDVVAMVLVDAHHERQFDEEEFRKFIASAKAAFPIIGAVTTLGITRLMLTLDLLPPLFAKQEEEAPSEIRPMLRAGWAKTRYFATMADEEASLEETSSQVKRSGLLGDLPLVVITATGATWWPAMPKEVDRSRFRHTWLNLQADLMRLSTNSRQVFADRSSHFVNFDQPEIIVDQVRRLIEIDRPTQLIPAIGYSVPSYGEYSKEVGAG